jgi:hypothetical protein
VTDLNDLFERLAAPFPADAVSWRVGNTNVNKQTGKPPEGKSAQGMALAYLDARDVMDRLDLVCGPAGWERRHPHVGGTTTCEIAVWVEGRGWIVKSDGAGDTQVEAEKGSLSDAFKRAAVNWGIGRYLYGLPSPWVALDPAGRSWKIKDSEYAKLRQVLAGYTGVPLKSAMQAKKDRDFEFYKAKIDAAQDLEELGAVGREIAQGIGLLPAQHREPLQDAYGHRRNEIVESQRDQAA